MPGNVGEVWYDVKHIKQAIRVIKKRQTILLRTKPEEPEDTAGTMMRSYQKQLEAWQKQWDKAQEMRQLQEGLWAKFKPAVLPRTKDGLPDSDALIHEAFLRTLSRFPTEQEMKTAKSDVAVARDLAMGIRDLLWALLNTREFMVNH